MTSTFTGPARIPATLGRRAMPKWGIVLIGLPLRLLLAAVLFPVALIIALLTVKAPSRRRSLRRRGAARSTGRVTARTATPRRRR